MSRLDEVKLARALYLASRRSNHMASLKKQTEEKSAKKMAKAKETNDRNPELKCWSQAPNIEHPYQGKRYTLQEYLNIPLHKKWGLTIKMIKDGLPENMVGKSKDKRLTEPCKGKVQKKRNMFCSNCKRRVRKFQLKTNNPKWLKRSQEGTAGHHKKYRGKPTTIAKALKKLGEDPSKKLEPGKPLGQKLLAQVEKVLTGKEVKPINRHDVRDTPKIKIHVEKRAPTGSKVKQGPISKPKRSKKDKPKDSTLPLSNEQLKNLNAEFTKMVETASVSPAHAPGAE